MSGSYLLVGLADNRYALAVEDVIEVGLEPDPTPLPGAPPSVLGLQNIRGQVMPLVDVASLLGAGDAGPRRAMVVVEQAGQRAALAVDTLLEVAPLRVEPYVEGGRLLRGSARADDALVGVIDTLSVLDALGSGLPE